MAKKKLRVGVLMGGPSTEREISLITGRAVAENLDKKKYEVSLIEMTKDFHFILLGKKEIILDFVNKDRKRFDLIFIALHGSPGEDGTIQGMFDMLCIKYTGSNTLSSAMAMNKVLAAQIYLANGLPHPEFIHIKKDGWKNYKKIVLKDANVKIGYPSVVKPVDQGSSVGMHIVKNEKELIKALNKEFNVFNWMMVQKFVKGDEATCGILENIKHGVKHLEILPPTRIISNAGVFYDYKSKYAKGGSTHICPADFAPEINEQIQHLAAKAHIALGCRGMSRSDIFVTKDNKLTIIETNTIPGMTPTSLLPEAAGKAGISFSEMLDMIIKVSL